jgi:3-deoxy-D-arabino-heptulosonate 7-phosphate (DAHP) synthase class II
MGAAPSDRHFLHLLKVSPRAEPMFYGYAIHARQYLNLKMAIRPRLEYPDEVRGFFEVIRSSEHIQVESISSSPVTMSLSALVEAIQFKNLVALSKTTSNPRLNHSQSLELSFLVAEMLRDR